MFYMIKRADVDYTDTRLVYKVYQNEKVWDSEEETLIKKKVRQKCSHHII